MNNYAISFKGKNKKKKRKDIVKDIIFLCDINMKRSLISILTNTSVFEIETIKITRTEFNKKKKIADELFSGVPLSKYIKNHKNAKSFLQKWLGKSQFQRTGLKLFSASANSKLIEIQREQFLQCLTEDIIFNEFYERKKQEKSANKKLKKLL